MTKSRQFNSRILIVDDHPVYRTGLISLLQSIDFISNCYEAENGSEALEIINTKKIDVIFLDLDLPVMNGVELLTYLNINHLNQKPKVIIISMDNSKSTMLKCYNLGINGYISKTTSLIELKRLFQLLNEDEDYYCSTARNILFKHLVTEQPKNNNPVSTLLKPTEIQLLKLVCLQYTIAELAEQMDKSESAIKAIRYRLFKRIKVTSMIGAVLFAIENNHITLQEIKSGLIKNKQYKVYD